MLTLPPRTSQTHDDLLLRETMHRCSNDLQMVIGLLALQARLAASTETREALNDAMERVAILARARSTLHHHGQSLEAALQQVCEALHAQAEPRGINVSLDIGEGLQSLSTNKITTVSLVVNELATNAIKHAFKDRKSGYVRVSLRQREARQMIVIVDDDGLPFPELANSGDRSSGLGLGLVKRLMVSIGGLVIVPEDGTKVFELRVPVDGD